MPGPILDVANRLLPLTDVASEASRSVRIEGEPPVVRVVPTADLADAVAAEVAAVRHRHHNTGVVAPAERCTTPIAEALALHGLRAVDHVQDLDHDDVPGLHAEAVKGLEFDGVVVVNPHEIFDGIGRAAPACSTSR